MPQGFDASRYGINGQSPISQLTSVVASTGVQFGKTSALKQLVQAVKAAQEQEQEEAVEAATEPPAPNSVASALDQGWEAYQEQQRIKENMKAPPPGLLSSTPITQVTAPQQAMTWQARVNALAQTAYRNHPDLSTAKVNLVDQVRKLVKAYPVAHLSNPAGGQWLYLEVDGTLIMNVKGPWAQVSLFQGQRTRISRGEGVYLFSVLDEDRMSEIYSIAATQFTDHAQYGRRIHIPDSSQTMPSSLGKWLDLLYEQAARITAPRRHNPKDYDPISTAVDNDGHLLGYSVPPRIPDSGDASRVTTGQTSLSSWLPSLSYTEQEYSTLRSIVSTPVVSPQSVLNMKVLS